jgi:hypothetical protein
MTDGTKLSTCGYRMMFNVHDRARVTRVASTIGGLLHINGSLYALKTAHSLVGPK